MFEHKAPETSGDAKHPPLQTFPAATALSFFPPQIPPTVCSVCHTRHTDTPLAPVVRPAAERGFQNPSRGLDGRTQSRCALRTGFEGYSRVRSVKPPLSLSDTYALKYWWCSPPRTGVAS